MHPGNLMFRGRDVKIIDFDSARATNEDPCEGWESDPWRECDDFIRLGAWDVAKLSAGWHAAVAYMGPRIAAHWSMRQDCVPADGRCPPRPDGKRDVWPEWEAQAEVHAAAPDLAPRTMGYVAIDDAGQPTTTFVGLAERVEGTPLSELDMLRPCPRRRRSRPSPPQKSSRPRTSARRSSTSARRPSF